MIDICKKEGISIGFACEYFGKHRSGFYKWLRREEQKSYVKKVHITEQIKTVFDESKGTYGSPRVFSSLKDKGVKISENTVAKYMSELGLDGRLKKKFKVKTTDSDHKGPFASRVVKFEDENTLPEAPGEVLAGDITYLRVQGGFVYLAVVIDIFTREVVGWSMSDSLKKQLVLDALSSAMFITSPHAQVIFHSDRGSQYASEAYRKLMKDKNIVPSMSRKGNCYDNCYVESWFGSLKKEWIYRQDLLTKDQMKKSVFEYIEVWYNRNRKHSSIGYVAPQVFRKNYLAAH